MKASVRLEHQLLAVETEHHVYAMLELVAPEAKADKNRHPLHLSLVIDRSGSMAGPKLEHTKEAAAYLVRRLGLKDKLALVTYDDEVELLAALGGEDKQTLFHLITTIASNGSTNLSGGWLKGVEEAGRADGDVARKVMLLTDGLANVGVTDPQTLVRMAENARGSGVGTTTIGFGEGFDERLLTDMAVAGGGNAHYIGSSEDAPGVFGKEFEDLAGMVAQNVSVEIRPRSEVTVLGILNEYPHIGVPGGVKIDLGDAFAGESRRVVFELHIPELASLGPATVADVIIKYTSLGDEIAAHTVTSPLVVNLVSAAEASTSVPDAEVREEVLILKAARAQRQAREHTDRGEYDQARSLLNDAAQGLRKAMPASPRAVELEYEASLLEDFAEEAAPATWSVDAEKRMHYDAHRRSRARRPHPGDPQA